MDSRRGEFRLQSGLAALMIAIIQGACILTGLGFNGYDPKTGKTLWDRVSNVLIWNIETAQSYKVLFDSWNCGANVGFPAYHAAREAEPQTRNSGLA